MTDSLQTSTNVESFAEKLRANLESISKRIRRENSTEVSTALSEALAAFRRFFLELDEPEFKPKLLRLGDTARSETYNDNLEAIFNDISRFYKELQALADAQLKSFNFAQVVNKEILNRADGLASTVLDLNILSNFTRGDVIVAGDDFRSLDNVDQAIAAASTKAERLLGGGGMSLARDDTKQLTDPDLRIEVVPVAPGSKAVGDTVNVKPTPGNLERFYEGAYYNFLGLARPEGGSFNFKYVMDPDQLEENVDVNNQEDPGEDNINDKNIGFFVDLGASEDQKRIIRGKIFDSNPDTFWECEFLYRVDRQLLDPIRDDIVIDDSGKERTDNQNDKLQFDDPEAPRGASVVIDLNRAEQAAQQYDFEGRDLIVDLIINLRQPENINFVVINPILFGTQAFITVDDIATSTDDEGQFITIDGWNSLKYAKTITPEANEFLTDIQLGQTLAPNRYQYTGQGIYPFPVRVAKKVKLRLRMERPVSAPYERYVALLKNQVTVDSTITTTTKKGIFRF